MVPLEFFRLCMCALGQWPLANNVEHSKALHKVCFKFVKYIHRLLLLSLLGEMNKIAVFFHHHCSYRCRRTMDYAQKIEALWRKT